MRLEYRSPRPDLRAFVRSYYLFETSAHSLQPMCAEIGNVRFLLSGDAALCLPGRNRIPFAPAGLIGPTLGAYAMEAGAGARVFGAGVLPQGWRSMFGVSAAELADSYIDLGALTGPAAGVALERLREARDLDAMASAADEFFAGLTARRAMPESPYPSVLEQWLLDPSEPNLDHLSRRLDLSRRQADRIAKLYFGASPKLLQRKYRALRAADRILFHGANGWMNAAGPGFYDQSHFIREFRAFIGATPSAYAASREGLMIAAKVKRQAETAGHPLRGL